MEPPAAIAVVATVVLCLGYLLPQFVRQKHEVIEAAGEARSVWGARVIRSEMPHASGPSTQALLPVAATKGSLEMTRPVSARPSAPRIVGGTPAPSSADAAPAQRPLSAADTTGSRPPAQGKRPERAAFPAVAATQRGPVGRPTPPREARPVPRAIRERRARAARYRAAIAAALTLLALSGWVLVGIGQMYAWAPAIPTLLLGGVLVAGRRVALAQARADIVHYGRIPSAQARARAQHVAARRNRAVLPAPAPITRAELGAVLIEEGIRANPRDGLDLILDTAIDVDDAVPHLEPREVADATVLETPDEGVRSRTPSETDDEAAPPAEAAATVTDRGWTPPQVPPPAYTLRAPAERWEPKPLTEADYEAARAAAARLTAAGPEETGRIALPPNATTGTAAIDIDTAINKRRAAGQ